MVRISFGSLNNADKFVPITKSYDRKSKDGAIPIITMFLGTGYNERIDGLVTPSSVGNITNNGISRDNGKLKSTAQSVDETLVKQIATHTTFMYFWPGTAINGNSEIETATVGDISTGTPHTHLIRYNFEDLASTDKLIVELKANTNNAILSLIEEVEGVETIIKSINLPFGVKNVNWRFVFVDKGLSKFMYNDQSGDLVRAWEGTINADIRECKILVEQHQTETTQRAVFSDFIAIEYVSIFNSFDSDIVNANKGIIRAFDTNGTDTEANWVKVWSKDHPFVGDRVIENGIIRLRFKSTPLIEVFGWNSGTQTYDKLCDVIPQDSNGTPATTQQDVILFRFSDTQARIIAKYGIIDYLIDLKPGDPYVWINTHSKRFRVNTSKERFALSVNLLDTNLTKWNQKHSHEANRGNPLGTYQSAINPQIFTNDNNADTGLDHVDDNWFAFYNNVVSDIVGYVACLELPIGLKIQALDTSTLEFVEFTFKNQNIVAVGMLESLPTQVISGIPRPFSAGKADDYVKWRANESVFTFVQRKFVKKRR